MRTSHLFNTKGIKIATIKENEEELFVLDAYRYLPHTENFCEFDTEQSAIVAMKELLNCKFTLNPEQTYFF